MEASSTYLNRNDVMYDPILSLTGRTCYEKKRIADSPVADTSCQSTHRSEERLFISVYDGLG